MEVTKKKIGEIFTVERESAPSTGYRWYVTKLDKGLALIDFGFSYDEGKEVKPGCKGKAFFTFQALAPGKAAVQLTNYRTFEPSGITSEQAEDLSFEIEEESLAAAKTYVLGGWSAFSLMDAESEKVSQSVFRHLLGVNYTPLLVSKQLVNGTNYLFVCNARVVYPDAKFYAVLVKVHQPIKGEAEVKDIIKIGHPHFTGSFGAFEQVQSGDEKSVFRAAEQKLLGVEYTPFLVTTQIVSGRNYLFAANATVVYPGAEPYPVFVKVYQPLQGEIQVTGIIDAYDYK
jgi:predicted secreted protein/effector-binding domain-containing protein